MKKVLSLVLALVLVLGMIPTFAADATGAEALYDNGFITGKDGADLDAKLDVNAKLTRGQLAALIAELNGEKAEAAAFVQPAPFSDFMKIAGWAKNYVSYASVNGWMNGYTDSTFRAEASVPAQQLAAVLMNVLGYPVVWNTVVADAAALGIMLEGTALTRGEAFEAMWVAVAEVKVNGSEMTLGQQLGKLTAPPTAATDLLIDSVTADNLKAMTIVFNQKVDKTTVVAANFKVERGTTTLTTVPTLLEDGKTVVVVLTSPTNLTQSDSVKVTVDKVKSDTAKVITKYEKTIVVNDTKVPTANTALALNPKQVKITFSEPVQFNEALYTLMNDVKISGSAIIAKAVANDVDNTVLLTLASAMAEGTHTIEIKGIKDYAGFTAPTAIITFTVVKDETAPVALSVEVKTTTSVIVKFNEPVETTGNFKVNGTAVISATPNADKTAFTLNLDPAYPLGIGSIVEVKVEYKGQKDIMGNEVKDWAPIMTKVADDTTLPAVELTSVSDVNKIKLTFTKAMMVGGTIDLLNKDGVVVETKTAPAFKANTDSKIMELTFTNLDGINPADFSLKIKDMKDATVRSNPLATTTLAFKALDTLAPSVAATFVVTANASVPVDHKLDTITIFFSEAMNVASIENLSNYVMGGTPFSGNAAAVSAKAAADGKSVVITYENAVAATLTPISVFAATDIAGNPVGATNVATRGTSIGLSVSTVQATDVNTVKVTFNSPIKSVDPIAFVLINATTKEAITNFVSATVSTTNQAVVTFKTASAMNTSAAIYAIKVNSVDGAKNIFNDKLTIAVEYAVTDKIAPTLTSVKTTVVGTTVTDNSITFTFSEPIQTTNFMAGVLVKSTTGAVIANGLGGTLTADGSKLIVTFTAGEIVAIKGASDNGDKTIVVSIPTATNIFDNYSNQLAPVADQNVIVQINN